MPVDEDDFLSLVLARRSDLRELLLKPTSAVQNEAGVCLQSTSWPAPTSSTSQYRLRSGLSPLAGASARLSIKARIEGPAQGRQDDLARLPRSTAHLPVKSASSPASAAQQTSDTEDVGATPYAPTTADEGEEYTSDEGAADDVPADTKLGILLPTHPPLHAPIPMDAAPGVSLPATLSAPEEATSSHRGNTHNGRGSYDGVPHFLARLPSFSCDAATPQLTPRRARSNSSPCALILSAGEADADAQADSGGEPDGIGVGTHGDEYDEYGTHDPVMRGPMRRRMASSPSFRDMAPSFHDMARAGGWARRPSRASLCLEGVGMRAVGSTDSTALKSHASGCGDGRAGTDGGCSCSSTGSGNVSAGRDWRCRPPFLPACLPSQRLSKASEPPLMREGQDDDGDVDWETLLAAGGAVTAYETLRAGVQGFADPRVVPRQLRNCRSSSLAFFLPSSRTKLVAARLRQLKTQLSRFSPSPELRAGPAEEDDEADTDADAEMQVEAERRRAHGLVGRRMAAYEGYANVLRASSSPARVMMVGRRSPLPFPKVEPPEGDDDDDEEEEEEENEREDAYACGGGSSGSGGGCSGGSGADVCAAGGKLPPGTVVPASPTMPASPTTPMTPATPSTSTTPTAQQRRRSAAVKELQLQLPPAPQQPPGSDAGGGSAATSPHMCGVIRTAPGGGAGGGVVAMGVRALAQAAAAAAAGSADWAAAPPFHSHLLACSPVHPHPHPGGSVSLTSDGEFSGGGGSGGGGGGSGGGGSGGGAAPASRGAHERQSLQLPVRQPQAPVLPYGGILRLAVSHGGGGGLHFVAARRQRGGGCGAGGGRQIPSQSSVSCNGPSSRAGGGSGGGSGAAQLGSSNRCVLVMQSAAALEQKASGGAAFVPTAGAERSSPRAFGAPPHSPRRSPRMSDNSVVGFRQDAAAAAGSGGSAPGCIGLGDGGPCGALPSPTMSVADFLVMASVGTEADDAAAPRLGVRGSCRPPTVALAALPPMLPSLNYPKSVRGSKQISPSRQRHILVPPCCGPLARQEQRRSFTGTFLAPESGRNGGAMAVVLTVADGAGDARQHRTPKRRVTAAAAAAPVVVSPSAAATAAAAPQPQPPPRLQGGEANPGRATGILPVISNQISARASRLAPGGPAPGFPSVSPPKVLD